MKMKCKKFGTAINCMDGRVQEPVIKFMKENHGLDYIDMITKPGPNKIIAENTDENLLEIMHSKIDISINQHGSRIIAIIGHDDCAGNPETEEVQLEHIRESMRYLKRWYPDIKIVGLWLDNEWKVHEVHLD